MCDLSFMRKRVREWRKSNIWKNNGWVVFKSDGRYEYIDSKILVNLK